MAERSRSDTIQLKARMKEPLRAKIEAAAAAKGISLNAEMVHRLESSFLDEEARDRELGGRELHSLFRMMGAAARIIEERKGQSCITDFETFVAVKASWLQLMSLYSPRPRQGSKYIESIGGLPLDFKIPPHPTPPVYPMASDKFVSRNALLSARESAKELAKEIAAYEKKLAAYEKAKAKWNKDMVELEDEVQNKLKAVRQHVEDLKDLGKEVALELFPPRTRG